MFSTQLNKTGVYTNYGSEAARQVVSELAMLQQQAAQLITELIEGISPQSDSSDSSCLEEPSTPEHRQASSLCRVQ